MNCKAFKLCTQSQGTSHFRLNEKMHLYLKSPDSSQLSEELNEWIEKQDDAIVELWERKLYEAQQAGETAAKKSPQPGKDGEGNLSKAETAAAIAARKKPKSRPKKEREEVKGQGLAEIALKKKGSAQDPRKGAVVPEHRYRTGLCTNKAPRNQSVHQKYY